jgi:hypothetical protein
MTVAGMEKLSVIIEARGTTDSLYRAFLQSASIAQASALPLDTIEVRIREDVESTVLGGLRNALEAIPNPFATTLIRTSSDPAAANQVDVSHEGFLITSTPDFFFVDILELEASLSVSDLPGDMQLSIVRTGQTGAEDIAWSEVPVRVALLDDILGPNYVVDFDKLASEVSVSKTRLEEKFERIFSNALFWEERYTSNPDLGSGIGSRTIYSTLKRQLLNRYVVSFRPEVLDWGCGDLWVASGLDLAHYTGVDLSHSALDLARSRRPDWEFLHATEDSDRLKEADVVLCFDVLIHQRSREDFMNLLDRITSLARCRLVVSGFDWPMPLGGIVFFHEPLRDVLSRYDGFKSPVLVARYEQIAVYVLDRIDCPYPDPEPLDVHDYAATMMTQIRLMREEFEPLLRRIDENARMFLPNLARRLLAKVRRS